MIKNIQNLRSGNSLYTRRLSKKFKHRAENKENCNGVSSLNFKIIEGQAGKKDSS